MNPDPNQEPLKPSGIFTKNFDRRVRITLLVVVLSGIVGTSLTLYTAWPSRIAIGYAPKQPITFSHQLHAGSLEIKCRYCHSEVDRSAHATIPSTSVCMKCHGIFRPDPKKKETVARIDVLYDYWNKKKPVVWNKVYDLPDFVHFYHSAHTNAGLDCRNCHGAVETMPVVKQETSLMMAWCIKCHKGEMNIEMSEDALMAGKKNVRLTKSDVYGWIAAPIHCSTCHY